MKKGFWEKLRALFAKRGYTCDSCGMEVFEYPQKRLCAECETALKRNNEKRCPKCGRKTVSDGVCFDCKRISPQFDKGFSPFDYKGVAASLVNRFKNGDRYLANFLAEEMLKCLEEIPFQDLKSSIIVAFVPMTEEKQKERGYNQAEELANVLAERLGISIEREALVKTRETPKQKELSAKERLGNLKGAYRVPKRTLVAGKYVLLIDDIMTTSSTGCECARVLKNAGAEKVFFVTAVSVAECK